MSRFPEVPDVGQLAGVIGFDPVPSSPINDSEGAQTVNNETSTTLADYTPGAGKTLYITDVWVSEATGDAGIESRCFITLGGLTVWRSRSQAGDDVQVSFNTPLKVVALTQVLVRVFQWSGVAKTFQGGIMGFEV